MVCDSLEELIPSEDQSMSHYIMERKHVCLTDPTDTAMQICAVLLHFCEIMNGNVCLSVFLHTIHVPSCLCRSVGTLKSVVSYSVMLYTWWCNGKASTCGFLIFNERWCDTSSTSGSSTLFPISYSSFSNEKRWYFYYFYYCHYSLLIMACTIGQV